MNEAAAYEHFAHLDGMTEEQERALDQWTEARIDEAIEKRAAEKERKMKCHDLTTPTRRRPMHTDHARRIFRRLNSLGSPEQRAEDRTIVPDSELSEYQQAGTFERFKEANGIELIDGEEAQA